MMNPSAEGSGSRFNRGWRLALLSALLGLITLGLIPVALSALAGLIGEALGLLVFCGGLAAAFSLGYRFPTSWRLIGASFSASYLVVAVADTVRQRGNLWPLALAGSVLMATLVVLIVFAGQSYGSRRKGSRNGAQP